MELLLLLLSTIEACDSSCWLQPELIPSSGGDLRSFLCLKCFNVLQKTSKVRKEIGIIFHLARTTVNITRKTCQFRFYGNSTRDSRKVFQRPQTISSLTHVRYTYPPTRWLGRWVGGGWALNLLYFCCFPVSSVHFFQGESKEDRTMAEAG